MTNQQKINYIYDREKKREFDECVSKEYSEALVNLTSGHLLNILNNINDNNLKKVVKKCKIKVYGK